MVSRFSCVLLKNWYQYFLCLFPFNWYQYAIPWHIFNWYLNWLSPLFGFVFVFRQKGGEHCLLTLCCSIVSNKKGEKDLLMIVLHFTLYWWLILCIKKGEKILFCFDCLPLCWWLTKRGRIICEFNMFNMHELFYICIVMFLHILSLI